MRLSTFITVLSTILIGHQAIAGPGISASRSSFQSMNTAYHKNMEAILKSRDQQKKDCKTVACRNNVPSCTWTNVVYRKEWGSMSTSNRMDYINAVQCLINKPSQSNQDLVPGARNRLDDFVAEHILQSNVIHFDGNLFAWHRIFTHRYAVTLQNECSYRGPIPYWDWTLSCQDQSKSKVFDCSNIHNSPCLGGNGEYYPHGSTITHAFGLNLTLPPGTGGGCVQHNPFKNLEVNLGLSPTILPAATPTKGATAAAIVATGTAAGTATVVAPTPSTNPTTGANSALNYNPRCLTRDLNPSWSQQICESNVDYLLQCSDVVCLEKRCDGWENAPATVTAPRAKGRFVKQQTQQQVHPAGHFAIGGLQNDPFASPGDPVFYLHHAQLDRMWSIWQAQDWENRKLQIGGTTVPFTDPPNAPLVTLQDTLYFGVIGPNITHAEAMSTIDNGMCYLYA